MNRLMMVVLATLAMGLVGCQSGGNSTPSLRAPITEFGAVSDGTTMNTAAIQKAIDHVATSGGGTLVVPEGRFLSGAFFLKKGVNIHLEKNGVLLGSQNIADFPRQETRIEGKVQDWIPALINGKNVDGLRVTGEGYLDGQGQPFWTLFYTQRTANNQTKNLDVSRPRLMFLWGSKDVQVKGIHFKDSGFWNLHLYNCQDVLLENLDIRAGEKPDGTFVQSPSTDGIDIDSCQRVTIKGCYIKNNDDCIALKGTKGPLALQDKSSPAVEDIKVIDCTFAAGNGFVTCGSEATVVRNVLIENCKTDAPGRVSCVLRLKMRTDTPQLYENFTVRNIKYEGTGTVIAIAPWSQYFDLMGQPQPTRRASNIHMSNITGTFAGVGGMSGGPGDVIENVTFENFDITVRPQQGRAGRGGTTQPAQPTNSVGANISNQVKSLTVKNVKINGQDWTYTPRPATNPGQ